MTKKTRTWVLMLAGWMVWGAISSSAQPLRVIDVNPKPVGSNPREFTGGDDVTYFTALVPGLGREVWRSDGTVEGTFVVSDAAEEHPTFGVFGPTRIGDRLCFSSALYFNAFELWCGDGTPTGTVQVSSVSGVGAPVHLREFFLSRGAMLGNHWYFLGSGVTPGYALWRTDGTIAGTTVVARIEGVQSGMARLGDRLLFAAHSDEHGIELWASDGTEAGTALVRDINPGLSGSGPSNFIVAGSHAYFRADEATYGTELWMTDGTFAGTRLAFDITSGSANTLGIEVAAVGNALYFTDSEHLWRTDGNEVRLISQLDANGIDALVGTDSSLFVVSSDRELIHLVDDTGLLTPLGAFADDVDPAVAFGDHLAFSTREGVSGTQLWVSDGTTGGTEPITTFPASSGVEIREIASVGGRLWLTIREPGHGAEPWVSDGTTGGTRLVRAINENESDSSVPRNMIWSGGQWIFFADDGTHGTEPWTSDGTDLGTRMIRDIAPGRQSSVTNDLPEYRARLGDRVVFSADDGVHGSELWITDGTELGTRMIRDIASGGAASSPRLLTEAGGQVFFFADDGVSGQELWRTDGTETGTILLADLASGPANSLAFRSAVVDGLYFVAASEPPEGFRLWRSDGTPDGTVLLQDGVDDRWLLPFGRELMFFRGRFGDTHELWTTDGTPGGTRLLDGIPGQVTTATELEGRLVWAVARDESADLWRSDGSVSGAHMVRELWPGRDTAFVDMISSGRLVYFRQVPLDALEACRIWVTDGTHDGTRLLRGVGVGNCSTLDSLSVNDRYFFEREVDGLGQELWTSDGSFDGTHMLADLWPGRRGSLPKDMASNGRAMVFAANDGTHGDELWILDDPCLVQSEPLWLHDGRFKAEACWRVEPDRVGAAGPLPITNTTGGLFFFNPANLDLALKIHDGRPANGKFWFFLAGLTNVAADVRVVDMHTGRARDFALPGGSFESTGSISGFPDLPPDAPVPPTSSTGIEHGIETVETMPSKGAATCGGVAALCLNQDRFQVSVAWHTSDQQGEGQPVTLTDNSGTFWFFRPENVELFVKIHDGRPNNGHFWVFLGALSNVGYTVTVTDTQTGATREYVNEPGTLRSFGDTLAFPG